MPSRRRFASTIAAVTMAAFGFITTALPARANYDDMGPLADIIAVRAAYGHEMRNYVGQVIVRGDWAQVEITGKGFRFAELHRTGGKWSTHEIRTVPPDAQAFFKRVFGQMVDARNENFKPVVAGAAPLSTSLAPKEATTDVVAVPTADATGPRNDVSHFCRVLDDLTEGVEPQMPHAIRHVVIAGNYAIATVRVEFESFNVLSVRDGSTWSAPYAIGPEYPSPSAFARLDVPEVMGSELFEDLQRLNDIPLSLRKDPCT